MSLRGWGSQRTLGALRARAAGQRHCLDSLGNGHPGDTRQQLMATRIALPENHQLVCATALLASRAGRCDLCLPRGTRSQEVMSLSLFSTSNLLQHLPKMPAAKYAAKIQKWTAVLLVLAALSCHTTEQATPDTRAR